jgi:hypothetical protein
MYYIVSLHCCRRACKLEPSVTDNGQKYISYRIIVLVANTPYPTNVTPRCLSNDILVSQGLEKHLAELFLDFSPVTTTFSATFAGTFSIFHTPESTVFLALGPDIERPFLFRLSLAIP